jgi:hypothetical protein
VTKHALLDPQSGKNAIVDPPLVSRRTQRGIDFLAGKAGLL